MSTKKNARKPDRANSSPVVSTTQGRKSAGQDSKMYAYILPKDEREAKVLAALGYKLCPEDEHGENWLVIGCHPSLVPMLLRDLCRAGITLPTIEFDMAGLTADDLREIDQKLIFGLHAKVRRAQ